MNSYFCDHMIIFVKKIKNKHFMNNDTVRFLMILFESI